MTVRADTLADMNAVRALIAAAPDLLAALQDLIDENDHFGGCPKSSPAWDAARIAVQRAISTPNPRNTGQDARGNARLAADLGIGGVA